MQTPDSFQKQKALVVGGLLIIGGLYFIYQNNSSSFSGVIDTLTGKSASLDAQPNQNTSKDIIKYQNDLLRPTKADEIEVLLQETDQPPAADTTSATTSYALQLRPPENQNIGTISEVSLELTILGAKNISTKQTTSSTTSVTTSDNGKVIQNTTNQNSKISWSTKTVTIDTEQQTKISIKISNDNLTKEYLENGFLEIGMITIEPTDPETQPEFLVTASDIYTTEGNKLEVNLLMKR